MPPGCVFWVQLFTLRPQCLFYKEEVGHGDPKLAFFCPESPSISIHLLEKSWEKLYCFAFRSNEQKIQTFFIKPTSYTTA